MEINPLFIFIYSVGLAITLTGLNILTEFILPDKKLKTAKTLIAMGLIFIFISLYFLWS